MYRRRSERVQKGLNTCDHAGVTCMVIEFKDQMRLISNLTFHVFHEKRIRPAPEVRQDYREEALILPDDYDRLHQITRILPDHISIVGSKRDVVKGKHIIRYGQMPRTPELPGKM